MKSSRFLKAAHVAASFVVFFFCLSLRAQQHSLHVRHVPDVVRNGQASVVGQVETERQLHLTISLPLRNEDTLDALLQQIYDPQSPNFHRYLTPEQFADSFAPSQQDYDTVVAWAKAKGLQVTATTVNRRLVEVDAPVGTINRAFNVLLKTYQDNSNARTFHAPDREPSIDLAVPLLAISGLDDANPPHSHLKKSSGVVQASGAIAENLNPTPNITGSGPSNSYLPSDMRAAYYGSGPLDGTGQTVAIFSFDDYLASDLPIYYAHTGMAATVPVTNVYVNGYSTPCFGFNANGTINFSTCDDAEQILDIVNVMGMAPGLTKILFYESSSATSALNQIALDNTASVISSSWGGGDFGPASVPSFKQFQAQGQTYLNATGDLGQFNSSTYVPPSVDPNITQVGGTNLSTMGAGGPWSSETAWSDSGGGFISGTAIPTYQQLAGVINASNQGSTTLRNAPDVAAEGNFDNSTVVNGKFATGYGGTSFAAPRWAGYIALANQQSIANGHGRIGFLNPTLYNIGTGANYAANFHDITSGHNPPGAGSGNGFNAVTGYDLVTGWGSPNAALLATLAGGVASADFSLAATPNPITIQQGSTGTSTITVTGIAGFTGSVALSASLPTGVTASFSPTSTTGTSVLTLTVASTAPTGLKAITITGTSGSLTHTTNLPLNLTAGGDYSLSTSPTSVSAVQGAFGTSTVTITPVNSFNGPVALSATGLPAGVTASFSPASATTTSTLTLTASSTATLGQATVTITGTSGSLSHTAIVTLTVVPAPDYSLSASTPLSVVQGANGTSTVTVTALNNFVGSVALAATGLPTGVTASFSPASATTTSTLTLTASSTAAVGPATITVTGTSGTLTHTTTIALTVVPAPDYSLSASTPLSIVQGNAGSSTITVHGLNNFTSSVALSASGLPAGVTASFSPASTTSTSILTLTTSATATVGPATVTITGVSGSLTHTTTIALTVTPAPDYSLSATPVSVVQGNSGTTTTTVLDLNGFNGAVNLAISGLPAGVTASFSPASTTSTSILTLTASPTAAAGSTTLTITGTSGSLVHTTTVALTVVVPDYSLSAANPVTIAANTSGTSTIAVNGINGFNGAVNLTISGLPSSVTASFSPATTTSSSILTLTAVSWASAGTWPLTITGTSGSLVHTTTLSLTITPPPDFSFALSPNKFSVPQGGSQGNTITVTGLNGFTGAVTLSASGLRTGMTATFSPVTTTGTSTMTITADITAPASTGTIVVTGTSGSLSHQIYVSAVVTATPNYSLSASPVSIAQGATGTSTIAVTDISGFASAVALTASGLPTGVTASFSPATTTSSSVLTFTASSTATVGSSTITVTGTSGSMTHTTTLNLTITSAGDYSLSASPVSVVQGANGSTTVAVTDIGNFSSTVSLSASGLPAGVTASFNPSSTATSSVLTLTASGTAAVGPATITVTGVSGSLTHTATFTLTVAAAPDYSLSASSGNVSVVQGNTGTSTITVNGVNNFTGSVALSATGLPAGVTASFSPSSTSGSSILTLTAAGTATVGPTTVTVTGTSGSLTHTTTVALTVVAAPDYSLSAGPNAVSVVQGNNGASTITVNGINNFTGSVALSATGLPAGVTASFSPSSTTGTSILTLVASTNATVGPATITITGTSGALTHTTTVTLTVVAAPDYTFSASQDSMSVVQGNSASSTITVDDINNFSGAVTLSASGLPAGVTASFSPSVTTGSSVLTLTASSTATVGPATIMITGVSGSLMHTTTIALTVVPAPDYSLSASPNSVSVVQGNSGTSTVTVNGLNNFTGAVSLVASGLPAGVAASFSPSSTTTNSILTLTASGSAVTGPATIIITGTSGSLTHTTTVALTVVPAPDYALSASSVNVVQGASGNSTITVTALNNFTSSVGLVATGLPAGVTASFSPASATTSSTLTLTASSAATLGATLVTITGTSGSLIHTTTLTLTITSAPDYSLSASSVTIGQGSNGASTINVIGLNGFNGAVNLAVSGLPAGVTASFSPASTTGSSILTLTASTAATVGSATVTVTGISGSLLHTTTFTLTVLPPDYSLSATQNTVSFGRGASGTSTIAVNGINGFSGAVNLTISGLPSSVTASFSPATTTSSSILTLTAVSWASPGTWPLTITGTSGSLVHTTTVTLTIVPPPDFSFALSPTKFNVPRGGSQSNLITVTGLNGFNSAVTLSVSGLRTGMTATFSPVSTTGTSIMTITADNTAPASTGTLIVTGTSGSLSHEIYVSAVVTVP